MEYRTVQGVSCGVTRDEIRSKEEKDDPGGGGNRAVRPGQREGFSLPDKKGKTSQGKLSLKGTRTESQA